ncbi:MAG: HEAT repeat domain-containing protein [Planctomycetes bacterium]|nr:HEAT repeat domain-containing protein [Planctomycetota bacterium]
MGPLLLASLLSLAPDLVVLATGNSLTGDIRTVTPQGVTVARETGNLFVEWAEIQQALRSDGTLIVRPILGKRLVLAWIPPAAPHSEIRDHFEAALRADGTSLLELRSLLASRDLVYARWRASVEEDAALRARIREAVTHGEKRIHWQIDVDRALRDLSKRDDALVRRAATERLGAIPITEASNGLILALRDPDDEVRRYAARFLGERASPGSVRLIAEALGDRSPEARTAADTMLEGWFAADASLYASFVRVAPRLSGPGRAGAYSWFASRGKVELEGILAAAARHDLDAEARASAVRALGTLQLAGRAEDVLNALAHPSWRVRAAGAEAAAALMLKEAVPKLELLRKDESPSVREVAVRALESIGR